MTNTHDLKTWPDYYTHLLDGSKTFEYRRNDRGFKVGDVLLLREWEPLAWEAGAPTLGRYTGREMRRRVTYMLSTSPGFVVMALAATAESATETLTSCSHGQIANCEWCEAIASALVRGVEQPKPTGQHG